MYDHRYLQEIRLVCEVRERPSIKIRCGRDVAGYINGLLKSEHRECFVVVPVNARHEALGYRICAIGTTNACPVSVQEVFLPCILTGAKALVVCHNHPSGDCTPSAEDRRITDRVTEAGELLGCQLLDHIILTASSFYSFADGRRYRYEATGEAEG